MLQYTDTGTGRFGALFSLSDGRLIGGGPALRVFPVEVEVSASRTGGADVTGLRWRDQNRSAVQAKRLAGIQKEEITFANGEVKLAGTLTRRTSGTLYPAVVLTHGSGPQYRQRGEMPRSKTWPTMRSQVLACWRAEKTSTRQHLKALVRSDGGAVPASEGD
jgi:hypothetical protein